MAVRVVSRAGNAGRCVALPERERYVPKSKDRHVPIDPGVLPATAGQLTKLD